mgnify:CR=1 FL=1
MKKLNTWLLRPYYFNFSNSFRFFMSFSFGFFTFLFLYFLTPFSLIFLKGQFLFEYVFGISIIVFLVSIFLLFVLPFLFKNFFNPEKWTIGKNVAFIFIGHFIAGFFLWLYNYKVKNKYGMEPLSLATFTYYTFIVGLFPSIFIIFFNEKYIRERKNKNANDILLLKNDVTKEDIASFIVCNSEDSKDTLKIAIENLVYIKSQSNYACFFVYENDLLKEKILRITLKKLEEQLTGYKDFYRCHKSYIINSNYINNLEGNARGYQLLLSVSATKIPVSRSFPRELLKIIIK